MCISMVETTSGRFPCGNCISCREARARKKKAQQLLEYEYCEQQALFITLTYAPEHLPRTTGHEQVAVYRESDLGALDFIYRTQHYEPAGVVPYEDHPEEYQRTFEKMIRAKKRRDQVTVIRRKHPGYVPDTGNELLDDLLADKVQWHMDQFQYPTHIVHNVPGAPTTSYAHLSNFLDDKLRGKLRRRGIKEHAYYAVSEMGDKTGRPHYHLNLFFREVDKKRGPEEWADMLRSCIKETWPYGFSDVTPAMPGAMAYTSSYLTEKKIGRLPTRSATDDRFIRIDGSEMPRDYVSRHKNTIASGLGYGQIPKIVDRLKASVPIYKSVPEKVRDKMMDTFIKPNTPNPQKQDMSEIGKDRFGITATAEQWREVHKIFLAATGQLNLVTKHPKTKTLELELLPMSQKFRTRMCDSIGLSEADRLKAREFVQKGYDALLESMSETEKGRELDARRSKAERRQRKRRHAKRQRLH